MLVVPHGVSWAPGQAPSVAPGLRIEGIASGLLHPRQLYVLPNGDVLVVESNGPGSEPVTTPKQLIAGKVKNRSGKGGKGGDRITLLRKNAAGGAWERHTFIETSALALRGTANRRFSLRRQHRRYREVSLPIGRTKITAPGIEFADLPGTVDHHWTKALLASPDGS
jgi:glucose/arabinose dehydrogenase